MTNKKRVGLSVPIGLYEELKQEAGYDGYTLNAFILQILWNWKEAKERKE